jgi:hypothetical protein
MSSNVNNSDLNIWASIILIACLFIGCSHTPTDEEKKVNEPLILETALNHFLDGNKGVFFVCRYTNGSETQIDSMLIRKLQSKFNSDHLEIHGIEEAELRDLRDFKNYPDQIRDDHYVNKKTGKLGESLTINEINWIDSRTVDISLGRWFGLMMSADYKYRLTFSRKMFLFDGQWKVEESSKERES